MKILQVSMADRLGGAERVAWNLFDAYRQDGHQSWLAVGRRFLGDPDVFEIRNDAAASGVRRAAWRSYHAVQPYYRTSGLAKRVARLSHRIAVPEGVRDRARGIEDFNFPGSVRLLNLPPERPDILHLHNLHGGYFDLRELPRLCAAVPAIITLHDAWLMAGHCAHSLGCERWRTGCGQCPDLSIYPAIRRDATAENWARKREIFSRCRLHVAAPSQWLLDRARQSMLAPAMIEGRVIPNGVDQSIFRPVSKSEARRQLGLPLDALIITATAADVANSFKDFPTLLTAAARLSPDSHLPPVRIIALGRAARDEVAGSTPVHYMPPTDDQQRLAACYAAADVYVHAARADTFPNSVIEALSCGTPVIATAVGGIPEQIRAWPDHAATGVLTAPGDASDLAAAITRLLADEPLRRTMSHRAAINARERFGLDRQVRAYLAWYEKIVSALSTSHRPFPEVIHRHTQLRQLQAVQRPSASD